MAPRTNTTTESIFSKVPPDAYSLNSALKKRANWPKIGFLRSNSRRAHVSVDGPESKELKNSGDARRKSPRIAPPVDPAGVALSTCKPNATQSRAANISNVHFFPFTVR